MTPDYIYQQKYTIRTYEIDATKRVSIPALVNLMHETAMEHVLKIKLSVWDLEVHDLSWVLLRMNINIIDLPKLGEEISIKTYPLGFEKIYVHREYHVYNKNGELLANATTTWLLMNLQSRRLARIPEFVSKVLDVPKNLKTLTLAKGKLPAIKTPNETREFRVNWFELDYNYHLNNKYYLQWMLETMQPDLLQNARLEEVDLIFKNECRQNDILLSQTEQVNKNTYLHRLYRPSDEKEIAQAQTRWDF